MSGDNALQVIVRKVPNSYADYTVELPPAIFYDRRYMINTAVKLDYAIDAYNELVRMKESKGSITYWVRRTKLIDRIKKLLEEATVELDKARKILEKNDEKIRRRIGDDIEEYYNAVRMLEEEITTLMKMISLIEENT